MSSSLRRTAGRHGSCCLANDTRQHFPAAGDGVGKAAPPDGSREHFPLGVIFSGTCVEARPTSTCESAAAVSRSMHYAHLRMGDVEPSLVRRGRRSRPLLPPLGGTARAVIPPAVWAGSVAGSSQANSPARRCVIRSDTIQASWMRHGLQNRQEQRAGRATERGALEYTTFACPPLSPSGRPLRRQQHLSRFVRNA